MTEPRPGGMEDLYIAAEDEDDVDRLVGDVTRESRTHPIVVLTSRRGETVPALDASAVRRIVGARIAIWFVRTGPLTDRFADRLPELHVADGAVRILAAAGELGFRSEDHPPLLRDRTDAYGRHALGRFRDMWEDIQAGDQPVPPRVARELARVQRDLAEALEHGAALVRQVSAVEQARDRVQSQLRQVQRAAAEREPQGPELSPDDQFRVLVYAHWLGSVGPAERESRPLGPYKIGARFMELVAASPVGIDKIAWACAQVICGRAPALHGLNVHVLRVGGGPSEQRVRAEDDAKAWRCALQTVGPSAQRMHYWVLPGGLIELASVGPHDNYDIP
jgi:hypothetical protein